MVKVRSLCVVASVWAWLWRTGLHMQWSIEFNSYGMVVRSRSKLVSIINSRLIFCFYKLLHFLFARSFQSTIQCPTWNMRIVIIPIPHFYFIQVQILLLLIYVIDSWYSFAPHFGFRSSSSFLWCQVEWLATPFLDSFSGKYDAAPHCNLDKIELWSYSR